MDLKAKLDRDLMVAMKAKNAKQMAILRMLKSAIKNSEISLGHELTDKEVILVFEKQAKQRRDSIEQFKAGSRSDLAEKEADELILIEKYLPDKMSESDVENLIMEAISDLGATGIADMGKVIKLVMDKASGAADGKTVSMIVRKKLK